MTKKMLIDATHEEETRVAVTDGNKLVEYDYESQTRKSLKGSIYLAKVTRVEPSLQAAFVNFGGNRHGFLPFSEIHPDYFRIPVADREALIAEQEALLAEHDEEEALEEVALEAEIPEELQASDYGDLDDNVSDTIEDGFEEDGFEEEYVADASDNIPDEENVSEEDEEDARAEASEDSEHNNDRRQRGRGRGRGGRSRGRHASHRNKNVEVVGGEDVDDEHKFRFNLRRKYKIQEVIKRGQIMLVQANKEERGNKGAAVGTYLSLPGRYCVLMPNSPRAGGVSRKIANHKDRARMREIVKDLDVPKGMSVIVRTAGVTRTKAEIKRDLDYLMRLWNNIRELTLESTAPAIVYEEANLIKRSVRDLYTRDIDEIIVSGEEGYKTAKNFMKMLVPSHVKKVQKYEDDQLPLFNRYQIESQIDEIGQMEVRLKSGGYLVINPTEALVSIDVNSGKATKGRHIEETALKTNLEAAEEVARQLKLRDLGGLVVIDFIDMENRRNNAKVERRMKDALSTDRARVQVGRISSFGLMELSRQRLSPSLTEAQYEKCSTCMGSGVIRTADAMSIIVLRMIEDEGIRGRASEIIVEVTANVAMYLINYKREKISTFEERYGFKVLLRVDETIPASECRIEVSKPLERDEDTEEGHVNDDVPEGRYEIKRDHNDKRRGRRGGRGRGRNRKQDDQDHDQDKSEQPHSDHNDSDPDDASSSNSKGDKSLDDQKKSEGSSGMVSSDKKAGGDAKAEDEKKPKSSSRRKSKAKADENDDTAHAQSTNDNVKEDKLSSSASTKTPEKKPDERKTSEKKKAEKEVSVNERPAKEADETPKSARAPKKKSEANDDRPAKEYERVNEPPKEKKKGWWNRLVE